ncbi:MAG: GWxTD domain-containing protein [Acidobacteriota bacterium]
MRQLLSSRLLSPSRLFLVVFVLMASTSSALELRDPDELFNPFLGIDYSHWLVGPISEMATDDEVEAFLLVTSDDGARQFIDAFWTKRAEGYGFFDTKPRDIFAERSAEADKRYSEAAYAGSRTDRGMVFILYGEPTEIEYETDKDRRNDKPVEVWKYDKDSAEGLNEEKPKKLYRFIKTGDLTELYERAPRTLRTRRPF